MPSSEGRRKNLEPNNPAIQIPPFHEFMYGGVPVKFPYKTPFNTQKVTMAAAMTAMQSNKHALLESPTGTGKSLALLASTLSYMEKDTSISRVYYTSRTHAQLKQVVSELRKLPHFPKMSTLGSRKKLCIYPPVRGAPDINAQCKEIERHGGCPYDRVKGEIPYFSISGACPKFDLEDLITFGQEHQMCPYYISKKMAASAELIVCPYNYLLSPGKNLPVTNSCIVVFDEGHNIDSMCREETSFVMSYKNIMIIQNDAARAPPSSSYAHIFAFARKLATGWLNFLITKRREYERIVNPQQTQYLLRESYQQLISEWGFNVDEYSREAARLIEWAVKIEADPAAYKDYLTIPLVAFAEGIAPVLKMITSSNVDDFRVAFMPGENFENDHLAVLCMRPSILFHTVSKKARSVIIASGTLEPFESLAAELESDFDIRRAAPHVVDESQILTIMIDKLRNFPISSSYRQMQEHGNETLLAVSEIIEKLIAYVPGSSLLFLPSYKIKKGLLKIMNDNGSYHRISHKKKIIEEESDKTANEIMWEMKQAKWKSLMVGVHRGKMSEGVDFNDDKARAVFLFGIPYPAYGVADVDLKMKFNDQRYNTIPNYMTGRKWYEIQAYRALSQSLGRCIRHPGDYGAVILMDYRIAMNLEKFPVWVRKNMHQNMNVLDAGRLLGSFFTEMHRRFPKFLPPPIPSSVPYVVKDTSSPSPVKRLEPRPRDVIVVENDDDVLLTPAQHGLTSSTSILMRPERPNVIINKEKPPLNRNGTVIYCVHCQAPILTLVRLDLITFCTAKGRGFLNATMNRAMKDVSVMKFTEADTNGVYADIVREEWSDEDDCAHRKIICKCGCVLGTFVCANGANSQFERGSYVMMVRCMSMELAGQFMPFEMIARQIG